jgi:signal transduction histidine kinase
MSTAARARSRTAVSKDFKARYAAALRTYLQRAREKELVTAYELGRSAFAQNIPILEIVSTHHAAFADAAARKPKAGNGLEPVKLSGQFLTEVFSPYELGRRAYDDTVVSLRHLNELLEQEVKRLAHTVHDEAGQLLVAAHLAIAEVMNQAKPEVQTRLGEVTDLLYQAEEHLREFSHELRPTMLDDLGLVPALRSLAEGVSKRKNVDVEVEATFDGRLPPAIEMGIYRVVQEALTNVTRHSRAQRVKIKVHKTGGRIQCTVQDDGEGFDAEEVLSRKGRKGLGLIGIQERLNVLKGIFRVESRVGRGSKLSITIPLGE